LGLAYGGTDTHLLLMDLKSIPADSAAPTGLTYPVYGEPAVRIMDLAGMVANKNTIPGDEETPLATGIRLGTPWVSQRGLGERDMDTIAELIHRLLTNVEPFAYNGLIGTLPRGKVDLRVLEEVRLGVAELAERAGIDFEISRSGYPQYTFLSEDPGPVTLRVTGWRARQHIDEVVTSNALSLQPGDSLATYILDRHGELMDEVLVAREEQDEIGRDRFLVTPTRENAALVTSWLRGLAEGYTLFDEDDIFRKVQGPVVVEEVEAVIGRAGEAVEEGSSAEALFEQHPERFDLSKPYFVGQSHLDQFGPQVEKERWTWEEPEHDDLKRTPLNGVHKDMGARMVPFAGWEMPVWYSSVKDEHQAVREAAGLFDVGHMGVFEVTGPNAITFLDTVFSNYAAWIEDGQSMYGYFLQPDGSVIDDGIIYRVTAHHFYMIVNASNEDKDWDWLSEVNSGRVIIDGHRPWVGVEAQATLRNLKDPAAGENQKRDLALQGPASLEILQRLTDDPALRADLERVRRTELIECKLSGVPAVVARTGYTGEEWGYEILVHPDDAATLWNAMLEAGESLGVKPCGLACRDSTRIEAGLPLYGHELAGPFHISPIEAGFPGYVKYHKPFFVGRSALLAQEDSRERALIRFRVDEKGTRRPDTGDPVVDRRGREIGNVTSCSIDVEGFLVGLAIVNKRYNVPGTPIAIFPLRGKSLDEALMRGRRVALPIGATVLTRFPEAEGARPPWMGVED
jgi:glycine hydroxymethyltransferase